MSAVAIKDYPFYTATFTGATTKHLSKRAVGFHAGVDISRLLSSNVGVGALVRYSRGDVKFDDPDIGRQTVKAGASSGRRAATEVLTARLRTSWRRQSKRAPQPFLNLVPTTSVGSKASEHRHYSSPREA